MDDFIHIPVLKNEVVNIFKNISNGYILDATCGFGGHSEAILKSNNKIKLICNDQDDDALEYAKKRLYNFKNRIIFNKGNFCNIIKKYKNYPIRGILADIGVSSYQIDNNNRGFRFNSDILDMRMDKNNKLSAYEVVNFYQKDKLEYIFKNYADIKSYKKVSDIIINNRVIKSSKELSSLFNIKKNQKLVRLIFQAIRIEVNNELGVLKEFLDDIKKHINDAIIVIISFHSLEDRIVKNSFKLWSKKCICDNNILKCECGNNNSIGKILTKTPIVPTKDEIAYNSRSKSSKMRIFKIDKFLHKA